MSHRTRRARLAAAASAAALAGGLALGMLTSGGSASIAGGTVVSEVVAPVVPITSVIISDSGVGDSHTSGTRIG